MRRSAALSLVLAGVAAALVLASFAGAVLAPDAAGPGGGPDVREWVVAVVFTAIGARLAADRHRVNAVAWLLLAIGVASAVSLFSASYAGVSGWASWLSQWTPWPGLGLIPLLLLLFPDGRLPSRRWRPALWITAAGLLIPTVALAVAVALQPYVLDPDIARGGLPRTLVRVAQLGVLAAVLGGLVALAALFVRYRRAGFTERLQLKWVLVACPVVLAASIIDARLSYPWARLVGAAAIPIAVGVAILRYRLYDIDRIISRTIVYGLLTALLAGVYATGVFVLTQVLRPGGGQSQLAVAASTLGVAALFGPARRRIQRAVDRRFNRRRHDAAQLIEAFAVRLRDELDLDSLQGELLRVVYQSMEPERASLSLRRVS